LSLKGGQYLHDVEWAVGANPEIASVQFRFARNDILCFFNQTEYALAYGVQILPRIGQFQVVAPSMEERDPVVFFEGFNLSGYCRLRDIQEFGGLGEPAFGGEGMEGAQLGVFHSLIPVCGALLKD
jgi:hypothetical protein